MMLVVPLVSTFVSSALIISSSTLAADGRYRFNGPSRAELEATLTSERFDDSCEGPGPGESCPPINILRVFVRAPRCSPWPSPAPTGGSSVRLVRCRYLVSEGIFNSKRSRLRWQPEAAVLRWAGYRDICLVGEKKFGDYCGSNWTVEAMLP